MEAASFSLGAMKMHGGHQMPAMPRAPKLIDMRKLEAFADPLPKLPVTKSGGVRPHPDEPGVQLAYYHVPIHEFTCKVHRDIPATRFWGYGGSFPGPTIETRSGEGVLIEWPNELPAKHFLTVDHNLMGAEANQPEVRTVVHLHGAKTGPLSDGYPEDWYVPGKSVTYHYPNKQEAAMLWYHDHAMGINRLNIMAGMMGLFIIRDAAEEALHLPSGDFEIPLVICDRTFQADGQLYYPVSQRPEAPWLPEFAGDANLVNGKVLPHLDVLPRKYRFRILNGSNALFYFLSLSEKLPFHQIGTDQGLLAAPVPVTTITLAPAERADVVIDFAGHEGKQILLKDTQASVMQFRVKPDKTEDRSVLPAALRPIRKMAESEAVRTRPLTLEEFDNVLAEPVTHLLCGKRWHEPISENPVIDTTEIWSLINLTDDVHPIHLHLVRFQILDRRPFDVTEYLIHKRVRYTAAAVPPEAYEDGWKDTVRATPGAVTRIIVKFEGFTGRYVWHCHILEHEDNEMMRPYEVVGARANAG